MSVTQRPRDPLLRRVVDGLSRFLAVISALLIMVIMVAMVSDVARRYFTGASIPGVIEYTEVMMVAVIYLGLAYAQRKGDHIGVDIFTSRMPTDVARYVQAVGLLIVTAAMAWVGWETLGVARNSVATGEYRFGLSRVPIWPARITIPLGISLLIAQLLFDIVDLLRGAPPSEERATATDAGGAPPSIQDT